MQNLEILSQKYPSLQFSLQHLYMSQGSQIPPSADKGRRNNSMPWSLEFLGIFISAPEEAMARAGGPGK